MNTKQWIKTSGLLTVSLLVISLVISNGGPQSAVGLMPSPTPTSISTVVQTPTRVQPTPTPTPVPTLSLEETSAKEFVITDFDAVHAPVNEDTNEYLIFGNIPVSKPAANLPPELAIFLGQWEGYSYGPPIKKDMKFVMVIQEITAQGGNAFAWSGTNLQYPDRIAEIKFRVKPEANPAIEFQFHWPDGTKLINTFSYDRDEKLLRGWIDINSSLWGPLKLSRTQSFYVYKDYARYLAGKRIYPKEYKNKSLQSYGQGYLLYLPEGYEDQPEKAWPLIFFLHGVGDRGDNIFLLAKASPFMFIREKGSLPFIIAAPLLSKNYTSFPEAYMDGVLAEIQADYRVEPKQIYVTGLSMGGEAAYRFALHQPDTFAAIAPLSAFMDNPDASMMKNIKDVPVWAIHGAEDSIVSLARGKQPVDALKEAGGKVQFTVLEGHDHDVWTDIYSDAQFYDWLLEHRRP